MAHSNIEKYGLIGKNIGYSFSKKYFTDKFETEKRSNFSYANFDLSDISEIEAIVSLA